MFKYRAVALALKAFSINDSTKRIYRRMANAFGGKRRAGSVRKHYLSRADKNLAFIEQHGLITDGMCVLELGTGWVHWEALFTRAFYDVKVIVFDVWDNRQFGGFLTHVEALKAALPSLSSRGEGRTARARNLLERVGASESFDEAYEFLGFEYLLDSNGSLASVPDESLDLVFSSDVLEHIPDSALPTLAADLARVLRPGGVVSQLIVPADHLCIYARNAHGKSYLQYTDLEWKLWFENEVQYQNRWQQSDFRKLFEAAGFTVVAEEVVGRTDTSTLEIADRWRSYSREDLDATVTRMLLQKPEVRETLI